MMLFDLVAVALAVGGVALVSFGEVTALLLSPAAGDAGAAASGAQAAAADEAVAIAAAE